MTVRRYGRTIYGDGALYGATDIDQQLLSWGVEIDWDEDGAFDGQNEAAYMTQVNVDRGRDQMVQAEGQGFETVSTGRGKITLLNVDGRYDAWNSSSPLYPNIANGKDIKIRVRDQQTDILYPVFYGIVKDIKQINYHSKPAVSVAFEDGFSFLRNAVGRVAVQSNITPHDAIGRILDAAKWQTRWGRLLESSFDSIRYFWSTGGNQAGYEISKIADSFLGLFFIDASGRARYVDRASSVSGSVVDLPQEYLLKDISNPMPFVNRRNVTRFKAHPRTTTGTVTLFELAGNSPSVQTGAANAFEFFGDYSYNGQSVPALSVIAPVATTDYLFNTLPDGSGTNVTASCSLTATNFGDSAKFRAVNNSGAAAYLIMAKLRGVAIYEVNSSEVTYPNDASTVKQPHEFILDLPWQQDLNTTRDLADAIGAFLEASHPFPIAQIEARPDLQFAPDLFDVVTGNMPKLGIDNIAFRVGSIHHQSIHDTCQNVRTRIHLEPYITSESYWTFPIVDFGNDTIFGW